METDKGKKYLCPVVEVYKSNGALFYVVNMNGFQCTVKAFEYQKGRPTPAAVQCIVKGMTEAGEPILMQDIAAALQLLYKVGETYEFKVKADNTVMGYYEVVDRNGFIMRLTEYGNAHFYVNQVVTARVMSINLVRVELALVAGEQHEGLLFLPPDKVFELDRSHSVPVRYLNLLFGHTQLLREAHEQYESGNAQWLITAIDTVDRQLAEWLTSSQPNKLRVLTAFRSICVNVMEMSDYLSDCAPDERDDYQKRIGTAIRHADDYLEALTMLRDGSNQTYVDDCLDRLKHTGYLYQPENKMRVLMSLFTLRQDSVQGFIKDIFDVIRDSHDNERFMQQFKGAFIEMLDIYILHERRAVDLVTSTDDPQSRQAVEQMIEALAIQLLLVDQEECDDYKLYRSMLYRCATLVMPAHADALLQLSFDALFSQQVNPLEYGWDDVARLQVLCSKLATSVGTALAGETLHYHGNQASLTVAQQAIRITPLQKGDKLRKAYPDDITPWQHLQVLLSDRPAERVSAATKNTEPFARLWHQVDNALFGDNDAESNTEAEADSKPAPRKRITPDVGDPVTIRVLRPVPGRKYDLYCQIEDERFEGIGILDTHKVVHYNVEARVELFCDKATGAPLLLQGSVESVDQDGTMHFTLQAQIAEFINQFLREGDEVLCMVSLTTPQSYICITDLGFSLAINRSQNRNLKFGDYVIAEIKEVEKNGNVYAFFVEKSHERFDTDKAFHKLVAEYADGKVYVAEDDDDIIDDTDLDAQLNDDALDETYMEAGSVEELIRIIDRLAMTRAEQVQTFNYLAVARLLSRIIGNSEQENYFDRRMELVKVLQQFGDRDRITDEELETVLADSESLVDNYPEIKNKLQQLQIINRLGKPWRDNMLWQLAGETANEKTAALARLVLSHNMLEEFNVYDQLRVLRKRIYQIMDLEMQLPESSFVAHEDQFTELKSSMIYPAGNAMQPNERVQMHELMMVVCSFLNAKGGTLYVGVNNQGMAVGLTDDFIYLNNRRQGYDLDDIKDKFDLHFRHAVHNRLGVLANDLVSSQFMNVNGNWIYCVEVQPSSELVSLEQQVYVRQGTSKWIVPPDKVTAFRRQRAQRLADRS
ncbi:MAG: ATP-binding protein [Muribaculaceae bacterium]|nr:ATP-binding protein [Muribaculaceae bacterium]